MIQLDSIFAKSSGFELTHGDLFILSHHLLKLLQSKSGTSIPLVALQAESSIVTVQLIASFWLAKIPFIAIPDTATTSEVSTFLKDLNPDIIIGNDKFLMDVQESNTFIPAIESSSLIFDEMKDVISSADFETTLKLPVNYPPDPQTKKDSDSIFAYLFTSGTTSNPKCVPVTRSQILAATESTRKSLPIDKNDQWLLAMPLNHIGGISIITRTLILGSSLRYLSKFDVETVKNILAHDTKVTFCSLVPTHLQKIMVDSTFEVHAKFKYILLGGGPIPESLIETTRSRKIPVISSFGMTETTAQCIAVPFSEMMSAPLHSCGKPLQGVEIQIRPFNSDESDLKNPGLLWIRGPQIITHYLHKDDYGVFDRDGWFNTEDYAEIDANGYVSILMRRTDRIVTGGENVNPVEIENLLLQMPKLSDFAIVGLPDDVWGQKITIVITPLSAQQLIKLDDIKYFLSDKTASYKIPKDLIIVDVIPRTSSGKIKRSSLLKLLQNNS